MDTPLLLITWRRPDTIRSVIDAIRPVSPTRIYVACDGPSPDRPDEAEKVAATRQVIEQEIDWPCQVERLYSDINHGCRFGVSRAISWFFEEVEEGIILEDDCVPHSDFFSYCAELLERYRYDTRVWSICGSNFQQGNKRGDASYYFSIHGDSWGWASWRRAWQHYSEAESQWYSFRDSGRLDDIFIIPKERKYWRDILDRLFIEGEPSTWDFQWWLASWMNSGLHAWPNACLVSNRGFDGDATHTFGANPFSSLELQELGEIIHPQFVLASRPADEFAFFYRRGGPAISEPDHYGLFYPWILRFRKLRSQGFLHYMTQKFMQQSPLTDNPVKF